jgi:hypothetical protein
MIHYFYNIADHHICISFEDNTKNGIHLLPSFSPFRIEDTDNEPLLFHLIVDDSLTPVKEKKLVRKFDTGNGDTVVHQLPDGGYQFIIKDIYNRDCCLLICNHDFSRCRCALNGDWIMRSFGLNDALMLLFAFAGAHANTLLVHASCVKHEGYAYPFIAMSGTGKSTHSSLWLKCIENTELMNDDNPIIRVIDGCPIVYGSPWSGKTPCYRNISSPLGAIVRIERALENRIERQPTVQAFASLLPACSSMKWDEQLNDLLCTTLSNILAKVRVFTMYCLPNEEAARVCVKGINEK